MRVREKLYSGFLHSSNDVGDQKYFRLNNFLESLEVSSNSQYDLITLNWTYQGTLMQIWKSSCLF